MALSNGTLKIGVPPETIVEVSSTFTDGTLLATVIVNGVATPIYWKDQTPQETTGGVWKVTEDGGENTYTMNYSDGKWETPSAGVWFKLTKDKNANQWKLSAGHVLGWTYTATVQTEHFAEKAITFSAKDNVGRTRTFVTTWSES